MSRKKKDNDKNAIIVNISGRKSANYSEAAKEYNVSYTGTRHTYNSHSGKIETEVSKRSLQSISKSKLNSEFESQNLRQQSGFSAEVKAVAKDNAKKAIEGENRGKTIRTDDINRQSDGKGNSIGGTNVQLYDLAEIDVYGNYVESSGRQLKFVGDSPEDCAERLLGKNMINIVKQMCR